MSDVDRGDRRLEPNTPEWFAENRRRHGHPSGPHVRPAEPDEPVRASQFHPRADVSELVEMLHGMRVGEGPTPSASPAKPKLDLSLNIPTIVLLGGMLLGGVQGWNSLTDRIAAAERGVQEGKDRAQKYVPVLEAVREAVQGQAGENKMQNDRINAVVDALADERRARNTDAVESRKAQQDIMALIAKYADRLADIDKAVAVMQSNGRRSSLSPPERDAQVMQGR